MFNLTAVSATSHTDATESLTTLGVTGSDTALTLVGDRESGTAPYTTEVASGAPYSLSLVSSPNNGTGENDLFGATTAADGSTYAAGWSVAPSTLNHYTLIEHGVNGQTGTAWQVPAIVWAPSTRRWMEPRQTSA